MEAATAATMLLLALVVAAATTVPPPSGAYGPGPATAVHTTAGHGHAHRQHGGSWCDGRRPWLCPPSARRTSPTDNDGLTECVTTCGSGVTGCMLGCYPPAVHLDPVELPICLLKCTNDAMVCASSCTIGGGN